MIWYNIFMYLSKPKLKEILNAYNCEHLIENRHYQVEPDTWVYLFHDLNDKSRYPDEPDRIEDSSRHKNDSAYTGPGH